MGNRGAKGEFGAQLSPKFDNSGIVILPVMVNIIAIFSRKRRKSLFLCKFS